MREEAERYCALIETAPARDRLGFAVAVARALDELLAAAEALGDDFHEKNVPERIPDEQWWARLGALEQTFGDKTEYRYGPEFDVWRLEEDEPEAGLGYLDDDLADIWRDLKNGLLALDAGLPRASVIWDWRFGLEHHWGLHAIAARQALHELIADSR